MKPGVVEQSMGLSLRALSRLAGSDLLDRLGIRGPSEAVVHHTVKAGFATAERAGRAFKSARSSGAPQRLERVGQKPDRFDLNLTEEQEMMRDTVRRFAVEAIRPAAHGADAASATPLALLQRVHELGIGAMALPESLGGYGSERSVLSQALILEDLALGDAGIAVAAAAPLAVLHTLVDFGSAGQQEGYLPHFASEGFWAAALAIAEPTPLFDPHQLKTRAQRTPTGFRLHGLKAMVPLGTACELFVVAADLQGAGPQLFLVPADAAGVSVEAAPAMGLRAASTARLALDGVQVGTDALVGEQLGGFDYDKVIDRSRVAWAAVSTGVCQAVLEHVIPYCNERIAFGEPVSNRQSVAFLIANIAIELEGMRLLTYRAASRADLGLPFAREAALASLFAREKGMVIGTDGVQLLGGHGFVKDHPVERWYRDLRCAGVIDGGLSA